jgi:AraC-like DNA-binding protein
MVDIRCGRERLESDLRLARHRHVSPYIAVVLSGGYVEAGNAGRRRVEAGDVLVHDAFDAHLNGVCSRGAEVLNLVRPQGARLPVAGRVRDPDRLVRLAERDPLAAAEALGEMIEAGPQPLADWPDLLAAACRGEAAPAIGDWARRHNLAPATVSRGFACAYGVSPSRYRSETKALRAWKTIVGTREPLAAIAAQAGFADQAHMTRSVLGLTGRSPGRWRRSVKSVQDRPASAR